VAIAESGSKPDQTIVVIGGNSIFYGLGQNVSDLWTDRLQDMLGNRFAVFNFAMPAADPFDAAYWAAEALLKKRKKVLYITTAIPGKTGTVGGSDLYGYTFWDANEKHLLFNDKTRKQSIAMQINSLPEKERLRLEELQLRMKLDSFCYFEDLWTAAAYSKFFTVWTGVTAASPLKPREQFENETYQTPPVAVRFNGDHDIGLLRCYNRSYFELNTDTPRESFWSKCVNDTKTFVPDPVKRNCLIVVSTHAPAAIDHLTDLEKSRERKSSIMSQDFWQKSGYHSITLRDKLANDDFLDSRHLIASGGLKVATQVSTQVKGLAKELGFQ
jgi:hypothetical protein